MRRFGIVCYVLAAVSLLAAVTGVAFGPEWIERLTGLEPDGGDGSLEALLVAAPAVGAVVFGLGGYLSLRKARTAS